LQNFMPAENSSDEFSSSNFEHISTQKTYKFTFLSVRYGQNLGFLMCVKSNKTNLTNFHLTQ
jgi:hypothetical protein